MKQKDIPIGALIDSMSDVREQRRKISEEDKVLEAQYKDLEEKLRERLKAEFMNKGTGKKATASLSPIIVANILDWDEVCKFVKKTGHFQLFQRRISDPAYRELLELKKPVAGLEAFTNMKVNLRNL